MPNSWHVASKIGIVGAELRRRRDDRQFLHARRLRRHGRHQHRRRIRRRPAGHANADARQRQIALPQIAAVGQIDSHIALQNRAFEIAECSRESGGSRPETSDRPRHGRRPIRRQARESFRPSAPPCRSAPNNPAPPPGPFCARRRKSARPLAAAKAARRTPRSSAAGPPR